MLIHNHIAYAQVYIVMSLILQSGGYSSMIMRRASIPFLRSRIDTHLCMQLCVLVHLFPFMYIVVHAVVYVVLIACIGYCLSLSSCVYSCASTFFVQISIGRHNLFFIEDK